MGDTNKESIYPSEEVVLEELRQQRMYQSNRIDALDKKLATILGANGTIVTIVVALLGIAQVDSKWILFFSPALLLLLLGFVFAVVAIWPRTWLWNPSPKALYDDYLGRPPGTPDAYAKTGSIAQIVADIWKAYENNEGILRSKSSWLKVSLICEGGGLPMVVFYLIVYVLIGG